MGPLQVHVGINDNFINMQCLSSDGSRCAYHADGCECSALPQMIVVCAYHTDGCECRAISQMVVDVPTMLVNVSARPF